MSAETTTVKIAEYTRDPKKIAIIQRNAAAGWKREQLPDAQKDALDRQEMTVSDAHIRELRMRVGLPCK